MRMYNPEYQAVRGRLLVQEPLNTQTKWFPKYGKTRYVGGRTESIKQLGFQLPDVFQETERPMEPGRLIRGPQDDKARLAPFMGSNKPAGLIGAENKSYKQLCVRLSQLWPNLVHKPESDKEGTYFGFNVAKAHWLYPIHVPDMNEISSSYAVKGKHASTTDTFKALGGAYQTWPTYSKNETMRRTYITRQQGSQKFYELFDLPDVTKLTTEERRAYALQGTLPAPASTTTAPPSQVSEVRRGKAPTAIPEDEGVQEQTAEEGDALQTNMDGNDEDATEGVRRENALDISFVKESARNIEPLEAMLESEGAEMGTATNNDKDKVGEEFNKLAGFSVNTEEVKGLQPGNPYGKADVNPHWYSARHQPWPHRDLYDENGLKIVPGEVLGQADLDRYKRMFGSTHNLYLRGETTPKSIKSIEQQFGLAKSVIHTTLDTDTKLHHSHMCRILAIYFYAGEIGVKGKTISADDKQQGMLHGVWGKTKVGQQSETLSGGIQLVYGPDPGRGYTCLWPPVFKKKPGKWEKWFDFVLMRGENNKLHDCLVRNKLTKIKGVTSDMTVLQWVTSPWHYAFLPYQPQHVLFRDGETYSEGCTRCSRPFYEFEYMYSWYRLSFNKTQHWPQAYWTLDARGNTCGPACAPVPFHDARLWSKEQEHSHKLPSQPRNAEKAHLKDGIDEDGGWHNWPTFGFLLGEKTLLRLEFRRRYQTLEDSGIAVALNQGKPLTFRRYINHVYDPERLAFWGSEYPEYPQGRLSKGKVQLGMREYKLLRASKYGNCCKDCAAVLEFAPGLFRRNHRTVYEVGMVVGNKKQHRTRETWWTNLIQRVGPRDGMMNFDADHIFHNPTRVTKLSKMDAVTRKKYLQSFEDSMETYSKLLQEQHEVALLGITKYKEPPDIYIQKAVHNMADSSKEADHEMVLRAIKDLRSMLDLPLSEWKDSVDTKNKAFRDMVFELERKYTHKKQFKRSQGTRVFDSEMMRLEKRNEPVKYKGVTYHNCLVTRIYQPEGPATGGLKPPEEDYKQEVYYATRYGNMGECKHPDDKPTMWCGDGYVTTYNEDNEEHWVSATKRVNNVTHQWRKMRQSRLFITYSLHRATTSETEARLLMERMAGAAHYLFGNDETLSELLVFGYKLGGFGARGQTTDSISKGQFELIKAPNKKDQVQNFYGEGTASSYMYDTYETHIDSVQLDGGIEIGPIRHHPHFHILLTINHWSYIQIDYFKMNAYLEMMFRGVDPLQRGWGDSYKLEDASGFLFYTDNENPHVDIKLYPQDNWQDIIAAYVRKNAVPGILETLAARTGDT